MEENINIDPAKIKNQVFNNGKKSPFKDRLAVRGVRQRYIENVPWERTEYYKRRIAGKYGNYKTKKEIKKYLRSIDEVYQSMKNEGFIKQGKPIGVAVAKDGEVCFYHDGQHRITIAQILKIKSIPVTILKTIQ